MNSELADDNDSEFESMLPSRTVAAGGGGDFAPQRSTNQFSERCLDKIVAFAWVFVAVLVGYWTHVPTVLLYPFRSHPIPDDAVSEDTPGRVPIVLLLRLVACLLVFNLFLVLYLTIYVPRRIPKSTLGGIRDWMTVWSVYCPRVVPLLTVSSVVTFFVTVRATWPVWGFLAPAILSLQVLGVVFALHFCPWPMAS